MKKAFKLLLVSVLLFSIFSCSTTNSVSRYTYRTGDIHKRNIISSTPVVDVKIDLDKKITQSSSEQSTEKNAKSEAYYKAIQNNNIDIIVDPIYEVTKTSDKYIATIIGFAGYYENPRSKVDVIRELRDVDTLDIKKYNYLFGSKIVETPKARIAVLPSGIPPEKEEPDVKTEYNEPPAEVKVVKKRKPEAPLGYENGVRLNVSRIIGTTGFQEVFIDDPFDGQLNVGFSVGANLFTKFSKKAGFEIGAYYASKSIADNLRIPILLRVGGKRWNTAIGSSVNMNFSPKNFTEEQISFYEDIITPVSFGFDYALGYSINKRFSIDLNVSANVVDFSFQVLPIQSSLGLNYKVL